jgi:hypothetical protein
MTSPTIQSLFAGNLGNSTGDGNLITTTADNQLVVFVTLASNPTPASNLTQVYQIASTGLTFVRVFHAAFETSSGETSVDIHIAPAPTIVTNVNWNAPSFGDPGDFSGDLVYAFTVSGLGDITKPFDPNALSVALASQIGGSASAPTVDISTTNADDLLFNITLNSGNNTVPTVTTGFTASPFSPNPTNDADVDSLLQLMAVSAPQSATPIVASFTDTNWLSIALAFTADSGGIATPGNAGIIPNPVLTAGTNGAVGISGASQTVSYETDAANEIVTVFINYGPSSGVGPASVTGVTDTNGLTWEKRCSFSTPVAVDPNGQGLSNTIVSADIWWASSPTAQSGTITIDFSEAVDGTASTQAFINVGSQSAPWDTNSSLPAVQFNTTPPGGGGTGVPSTPSLDIETNATGRAIGFYSSLGNNSTPSVPSGFTASENFANLTVETAILNSPQTSPGFNVTMGGGSLVAFVFIADALAGSTDIPTTPTGVWASTEDADTMAVFGSAPIVGTFTTTEDPDQFSTSTGLLPFGFGPTVSGGANIVNFSTGSPDNIILLVFSTSEVGQPVGGIESISDTAGLEWHSDIVINGGPDANDTFIDLELWWAYSHFPLTDITITITSGINDDSTVSIAVPVEGMNGNFNQPFVIGDGETFFGEIGSFDGSTSTPETQVIVGSTPVLPSVVLMIAASCEATGEFDEIGIGSTLTGNFTPTTAFPTIFNTEFGQSQRDASLIMAAQGVAPIQPGGPAFVNILAGPAAQSWAILVEQLAPAALPPGTFITTEEPDTMTSRGFAGLFGVVGEFTPIEDADIAAIHGLVPESGIFVTTDEPDHFSAFGFQPLHGVWASTEDQDTFAAAGLGRGENGVWESTEAVDIFSAIGNTPVSGRFVTTEAADRFSALGAGATITASRRQSFVT